MLYDMLTGQRVYDILGLRRQSAHRSRSFSASTCADSLDVSLLDDGSSGDEENKGNPSEVDGEGDRDATMQKLIEETQDLAGLVVHAFVLKITEGGRKVFSVTLYRNWAIVFLDTMWRAIQHDRLLSQRHKKDMEQYQKDMELYKEELEKYDAACRLTQLSMSGQDRGSVPRAQAASAVTLEDAAQPFDGEHSTAEAGGVEDGKGSDGGEDGDGMAGALGNENKMGHTTEARAPDAAKQSAVGTSGAGATGPSHEEGTSGDGTEGQDSTCDEEDEQDMGEVSLQPVVPKPPQAPQLPPTPDYLVPHFPPLPTFPAEELLRGVSMFEGVGGEFVAKLRAACLHVAAALDFRNTKTKCPRGVADKRPRVFVSVDAYHPPPRWPLDCSRTEMKLQPFRVPGCPAEVGLSKQDLLDFVTSPLQRIDVSHFVAPSAPPKQVSLAATERRDTVSAPSMHQQGGCSPRHAGFDCAVHDTPSRTQPSAPTRHEQARVLFHVLPRLCRDDGMGDCSDMPQLRRMQEDVAASAEQDETTEQSSLRCLPSQYLQQLASALESASNIPAPDQRLHRVKEICCRLQEVVSTAPATLDDLWARVQQLHLLDTQLVKQGIACAVKLANETGDAVGVENDPVSFELRRLAGEDEYVTFPLLAACVASTAGRDVAVRLNPFMEGRYDTCLRLCVAAMLRTVRVGQANGVISAVQHLRRLTDELGKETSALLTQCEDVSARVDTSHHRWLPSVSSPARRLAVGIQQVAHASTHLAASISARRQYMKLLPSATPSGDAGVRSDSVDPTAQSTEDNTVTPARIDLCEGSACDDVDEFGVADADADMSMGSDVPSFALDLDGADAACQESSDGSSLELQCVADPRLLVFEFLLASLLRPKQAKLLFRFLDCAERDESKVLQAVMGAGTYCS